MKELQEFLSSKKFTIEPRLNEGVIRFDHGGSKNGWFIGWENKTSTGKPFVIAIVGDWRSGEKYEFKSSGDFTDEERQEMKALQETARLSAKKEREYQANLASQESEKLWNETNGEILSPYLAKKGFDQNFSAHTTSLDDLGVVTLIPIHDTNNKLWGIQKIYENGSKYFTPGQRIKGCFSRCGAEPKAGEKILLCEGFSTGATLHAATELPVFCALTAQNLEAVAEAIITAYRPSHLFICSDDDYLTEGNPGLTKATLAARATGATVLAPYFGEYSKARGEKDTDWNDLMTSHGLDEVKKQLDARICEPRRGANETIPPGSTVGNEPGGEMGGAHSEPNEWRVVPLGYNGPMYYYTSTSNPQINPIREHSEMDLLKLMPLDYWVSEYGRVGKTTKAITIDWQRAKSDLTSRCRANGIFENQRIRGAGVWIEGNRTVVHLGDRLFYDGKEQPISSLSTHHIYEFGRRLPSIHPSPLTLKELEVFTQAIDLLKFSRIEQKYFLGGWLAIAGVCGALHWRPHIWITGEQGSGKTTVVGQVIKPILTAFDCLPVQGATTEAGIRQSLRADATPVLFDEFESGSDRANRRVESVVELFRQASSDEGGRIVKGSASGEATEYYARFCGAVSSIQTQLIGGADKARFTLVELQKITQDPGQWDRLSECLSYLDRDYCERFFSRMVRMVPIITENQKRLQKVFAAKHSHRFGQQYGSLLAGWAALTSDQLLTDSEVKDLVSKVLLDQEIASNSESDHEECLNHLLHKLIRKPGSGHDSVGMTSVHQLIEKFHKDESQGKDELALLGVYGTKTGDHGPGILVLSSHPELKATYKDTRWAGGWNLALGRIKGALKSKQVTYHGKRTSRGTFLPMSVILGDLEPGSPSY